MTTLAAGFFGKIPTRGDFVRAGLPGPLVHALDTWCQDVLPGSRALLGDAWTEAWMEAPIWRFLLAPGACGPGAAAGLWLPSTDKAGRLFPLMILLAAPTWTDLAHCCPFLDAAESIGLAAIEQDVTPAQLAAALTSALDATGGAPQPGAQPGAQPDAQLDAPWPEPPGTLWWTDGSSRVAAARHAHPGLPGPAAFAAMLQD